MYKVIRRFKDVETNHIYEVGKKFPYDNREVSKERLIQLSTNQNALGHPFIEEIIEKQQEKPVEKPVEIVEEIEEIKNDEIKEEKPKRKRKK